MSDKADGFTVFHARCGRKLGIYIAVIGEEYIGKTESSSSCFKAFASVNSRSLLGMSLQDSSEVVQ